MRKYFASAARSAWDLSWQFNPFNRKSIYLLAAYQLLQLNTAAADVIMTACYHVTGGKPGDCAALYRQDNANAATQSLLEQTECVMPHDDLAACQFFSNTTLPRQLVALSVTPCPTHKFPMPLVNDSSVLEMINSTFRFLYECLGRENITIKQNTDGGVNVIFAQDCSQNKAIWPTLVVVSSLFAFLGLMVCFYYKCCRPKNGSNAPEEIPLQVRRPDDTNQGYSSLDSVANA